MYVRSGIDLVSIHRVEEALDRQGDRFASRVWTANELADCRCKGSAARNQSLAARWAAKEAAAKALGTGLLGSNGVSFTDIEVALDTQGSPYLILHNKAFDRYQSLGGRSLSLSLTHEGGQAAAVCVMLCEDEPER